MNKKKLLVISHDASRTGAPILLLHFLNSLKRRNSNIAIDIILAKDGALTSNFSELGNLLVLSSFDKPLNIFIRLLTKLKLSNKFISNRKKILKFIKNKNYDVIFSNTITNGDILKYLDLNKSNLICYVHELENSISRFTHPSALKYTLDNTNYLVVPSNAVAENLIQNHGVQMNKISLLNYFIPDYDVLIDVQNAIRKKLNLQDSIIVGGIGTCDWRKGSDIFLQVCIQLQSRILNRSVKFLWIGADKNSNEYKHLLYDATQARVLDKIIFIESVTNPLDYLSIVDIFLLTSREDPYPLVVLEAAMQKKTMYLF